MGGLGLTAEAQIFVAAAALYLYDSAVLLSYGEGLLIRSLGKWRVRFSTDGQYLAKRFLVWPPLGLLHARVYRLSWNAELVALAGEKTRHDWDSDQPYFGVLARLAYAQAVALALLLPFGVFVLHSETYLLIVAALIYLVGAAQAVVVLREASRWGLERGAARSIATEVILCPPFGLNVIKKVTLQQVWPDNLLAAASKVLNAAEWAEVRSRAVRVVEDELLDHDEESPAAKRLRHSIDVLSGKQA